MLLMAQIDGLERITLDGGDLGYLATWQTPVAADQWLTALRAEIPWSTHQVRIYGRSITSPALPRRPTEP